MFAKRGISFGFRCARAGLGHAAVSLRRATWAVLLLATSLPGQAQSQGFRVTEQERAFWSFQPLREPARPVLSDRTWAHSRIDEYILAKLEARGLKRVRAADRRTLIRRVTFDLVGLPPRPEEVEAFLGDTSSDAFAKVVDRLLASPHFGERWGRYWLDVARYAEDDVLGLSQESYPNAWRYRDWVVKAVNDDLSYDLFVKAQIAGDLVEGLERERFLGGLGFFGLGPWYYTIKPPPEARADERHDRVDTLTRGFLGLTVACARCHDHKFDPVSTQDYYALAGFFANTEYAEYPLAPAYEVERYEAHRQRIKDQEKALNDHVASLGRQLADVLARNTAVYMRAAWKVLGPAQRPQDAVAAEDQLDKETLERWGSYLKKSEHDHPYLAAWKKMIAHGGQESEAAKAAADFQALVLAIVQEKKEVDDENERILAPTRPKRNAPRTRLPNGFTTYDEFCPGCALAVKSVERDKYVLWSDLFREGKNPGVLVYGGDRFDRFLSPEWRNHLQRLRAELEELKKTLPPAYPYLHGIGDKGSTVDLRVHLRGSPYDLGEEIPRRFLTIFGGTTPFAKGSGRLELAEAIIRQPITARVAANRIWRNLLGTGIVETPSNFGSLGEAPSNPELLEYLARQLVDTGWSVKSLIREIALSATYQLSSDDRERNQAVDPSNRLCWRANRKRLDAEALRDSMLFVSGKLDTTIGGGSAELDAGHDRRTIYGKVSRFKLNDTLALFDFPHPSVTSEKRSPTQPPLQKLFFLNSEFVRAQAARLAERLAGSGSDDADRLRYAYRLLFARDPSAEEARLGADFLKQGDWKQLAQVLLSSNEFNFVD